MLGPLPRLYSVLVVATTLLLFTGVGALTAYALPHPILVGAGSGVGLAAGAIAGYLLVHNPAAPAPVPHRSRRRRLD